MRISSKILMIAAMSVATASAAAITPRWLRDVKISPDGSKIAFCYRGDIYTVPTAGGTATRLTSQPNYESVPVWSPDGQYIAYATDKNGNNDIYIISATGGVPTRLTYNSAAEVPEAFTPDGKFVVFSASIQDPVNSALHPSARMTELYEVSVDGGNPRQILGTPAQMISYMPDGKSFVYQDIKGFENEWRKHHTSSVTRDLWLYDATSGSHRNLTNRPGEDRNPAIAADGKTVYYLAERDGGTMNVYAFDINNPSIVKTLTQFADHPVRFLSMGADGTLAMAYDGDIYTMQPGSAPSRVSIDIVQDWENHPIDKHTLSKGAESFAVSPDGKDVAVTVRGEVLATSVEYPTTRLITATPGHEDHVQWGASARELIYDSDAHGDVRDIFIAKIKNSDDPNFPNATAIEERPLFEKSVNVDRSQPKYSPDHKKVAFVQDRNNLMVMDVATKSVKQLTDSSIFPQRGDDMAFEWSPDGRWIVMEAILSGREPYTDILLVNVETGEKIPVTQTGYFDGQPRWALDGQAILFLSERYGMRNHASWGSMYDAMLVFLNQEAYDKFRLSEEDYALKKEVEKASKKDEKKESQKFTSKVLFYPR
ncbi:MAG: peptidase S41, partial [Muribaculaceae bacterium]|nr:peptidase S41 [Muribaculaceae bacterium]